MSQADPLKKSIEEFRRFNRTYTQFLGTLREGYHDSPYSLTEARLLYELATRTDPTASDLCASLDLDPGYLSRTLKKLTKKGLISQQRSKADGRARILALKSAGKSAFAELNKSSDAQARTLLQGMGPETRDRFQRALETIGANLVDHPLTAPVVLRPHRPGDMGWVVHREGELYASEYGWDMSFEGLVAQIVAEFLQNFDPVRERCWIAEIAGERVGHIFLVKDPAAPDSAKLRLLLVEPSARGKGVGRALVQECVRFAKSCGYKRITLWTQSILKSAHRLYEDAGFALVSEKPHHSFGQDLVAQTWSLDLNQGAAKRAS